VRRALIALALAAAAVLGIAAPASADRADCEPTYLASAGRELFDVEPRYVPPPLRVFAWDCASRIVDEPWDDGTGISVAYLLFDTDADFTAFAEIIGSFERGGWIQQPVVTTINDGSGSVAVNLSAAELAALEDPPLFARARFGNAETGRDIIEMTYTDGETYQNDQAVTRPSVLITLLLSTTYSATGVTDPSTLSTLRTFAQVAPTAAQWGVIGAGSVMLMLVVGYPSALLNSVVGSRYQAIVRWVTGRFRRRPEPAPDPTGPRRSRLPGWLMWPGFALAAVLGAFVDPAFGWNWMSLRLVVTLFLSFLLFNLATWTVVRRVARRLQPDADPYLRFRWGSLVIVAIAVVVARLLELQPGVIFGLVAGIAYAVTLQASRSALVVLVGSGLGVLLGIVGWVGYSLLAPVGAGAPGNFAVVFLVEFLSGMTIKGVSTLPLSLLPLGNLDGAKVLKWKKWAWAVAYAVGLGAFMIVLVSIPKSWGEIPGDFLRWLVIFGLYALVAIAIWAINAWRLAAKPPPPEREQGDQPDAITLD
jgi:hypothetical protein